jgi:phosphoglycolate phosphatase-like HAD superfamily hydrolase
VPIERSRIQAICFDIDGTLIDTDDQFVLRLVNALSPFRSLFPDRDVHKLARKIVMFTEGPGNWVYSLADQIGLDGKIVAIGDYLYRLGIGASAQPFQMVPGVREMLAGLHEHYPLSIISARGQNSASRFLTQFELLHFFEAVATGQTCPHTKPYADPILWAAAKMGVPASSCLMVGDTVVDILCGKRAEAQTVGVLCGFGERRELEQAGADHILENTAQLYQLLITQ